MYCHIFSVESLNRKQNIRMNKYHIFPVIYNSECYEKSLNLFIVSKYFF